MSRTVALLYGVACYFAFFIAFLYLLGFLANFGVPKGIDDGEPGALTTALMANLALLLLFGLQHSVMARPAFKRWWTRLVPHSVERSTYVLASSVVLYVIYALWQPMTHSIWHVETDWLRTLVWAVFATGIAIALLSTFIIDHFDLLGLRQVYLNFRQRPYVNPNFRVALFYRLVRHPLYTGFFLTFWATPDMTLGHLVFASGMTVYVLIAVRFEERDLVAALGEDYENYREQVPMLVPRPGTIHKSVTAKGSVPSGMR
ncbi:MAG: methanethiol S-methyltransferase [Gammaproteobacteria bacterium]|jgi:protein-S-isoprenylcysteine O-methyltransferase Ste14